MAPFLRLSPHPNLASLSDDDQKSDYQAELAKLIPAEVVALYLAGKSAITGYSTANTSEPISIWWWVIWTLVCLIGLIGYRAMATSDRKAAVPPDWLAVILSAISFIAWIYGFGDVFIDLGVWHPLAATLIVLLWTFAVPKIFEWISAGRS